MRHITRKQINYGLPRKDSLRKAYRLRGETGVISNIVKTFESAYAYIDDCGVTIFDYGYGDAKEREVIYPHGNAESFDITNIIKTWLAWDSTTSRHDVVDYIYRLINDLER